jgi:hypothetical protein
MGINNLAPLALSPQAQALYDSLTDTLVFSMHLYQNDYTPTDGMVVGDFTEATFPGYVDYTLEPEHWVAPALVGSLYEINYNDFAAFIADGTGFSSQTIYGYWVEDNLTGLWWAERFDVPRVITPSAELEVVPRLRVRSRQY